jgi:hypothetical protein
MPPKLSYDKVNEEFSKIGCTLLSKQYNNNREDLIYECKCGHTRRVKYTTFQSSKHLCDYTLCKECVLKNSENNYFKRDQEYIHPKTFQKVKRMMERKYEMTKKYRSDYLPENYNKKLTCWSCKETKSIRLFPYRKQYKENKEKRCKSCNKLNHRNRVKEYTLEQHIAEMITTSKNSAKKRGYRGRTNCETHTITVNDILKLKAQQKNKCVYSGIELVWERNNDKKASIDRIDSTKGYTPDNIQLVTKTVNQAKNDLTHVQFVTLIKAIYNNIC